MVIGLVGLNSAACRPALRINIEIVTSMTTVKTFILYGLAFISRASFIVSIQEIMNTVTLDPLLPRNYHKNHLLR